MLITQYIRYIKKQKVFYLIGLDDKKVFVLSLCPISILIENKIGRKLY